MKAIRDLTGISQTDLAARVGIHHGTLSRIEQGSRTASPATVKKIALGLGQPIEAITYPVAAEQPSDSTAA